MFCVVKLFVSFRQIIFLGPDYNGSPFICWFDYYIIFSFKFIDGVEVGGRYVSFVIVVLSVLCF